MESLDQLVRRVDEESDNSNSFFSGDRRVWTSVIKDPFYSVMHLEDTDDNYSSYVLFYRHPQCGLPTFESITNEDFGKYKEYVVSD